MIRINLLGDSTAVDTSGLWQVIGYVVSVVFTVLICAILYVGTSTRIGELASDKADLERRLSDLRETTKEVKDLNTNREELRQKTQVIAVLKRNKRGPVRVMDELNKAIPEKAWISEFKEANGEIRIVGYSLEEQPVSDFMTALEKSEFFSKVRLFQVEKDTQKGFNLKKFTLDATVHYGGKSVPVVGGVVSSEKELSGSGRKGAER